MFSSRVLPVNNIKSLLSFHLTVSTGTGKSVLLRAIINALRVTLGPGLAVTAATGIAACNIGGCTLHSFAGCGLAKEPKEDLLVKINADGARRWKQTEALVIDESMYFINKFHVNK